MNPAHLHLLSNHVPILGSVFGLLILLYSYALRAPSQPVRTVAYLILLMAALGAVVANGSGDGAEDLVEHLSGVSHEAIEAHEDAAIYSLWSALVTGAAALAAMVFAEILPASKGRMALIVTVLALISCVTAARVGWLGGKIRHTEIETGAGGE